MLIEALDQAYDKIRRLEAQKNKREEEDADEDSVDKLKIIEKEEEEDGYGHFFKRRIWQTFKMVEKGPKKCPSVPIWVWGGV